MLLKYKYVYLVRNHWIFTSSDCKYLDLLLRISSNILQSHITVLNCFTGRVSVTALTKKQRKEMKKMDRRHKANQLRRNKKDMV